MSRALLILLGREQDKKLQIALNDLEKAAYTHTIDAKIVGDTLRAGHVLLREMGLESDATAKELYQTLRVHSDMLTTEMASVGLAIDGEVVSCNAQDITSDEAGMRQFSERCLVHFRLALAEEIARSYKEYIARPALVEDFLREFARSH